MRRHSLTGDAESKFVRNSTCRSLIQRRSGGWCRPFSPIHRQAGAWPEMEIRGRKKEAEASREDSKDGNSCIALRVIVVENDNKPSQRRNVFSVSSLHSSFGGWPRFKASCWFFLSAVRG
jgi:hypothetical protein